jgi:hypothetical protein
MKIRMVKATSATPLTEVFLGRDQRRGVDAMKKIHPAAMLVSLLVGTALNSANAATVPSLDVVPSSAITGPLNTQLGYPQPFQGAYAAFSNPANIALGASVMVSGTIPGFQTIHDAAFLTDGNYGNGRSWIGDSSNAWLTIDLGKVQSFDALSFGRDRLGFYNDRNPGQFTISVSNDNISFAEVFNSVNFAFSGFLGAGQTLQAGFSEVNAQYVRLQLSSLNGGMSYWAGVDEVEIKNSTSPVPVPTAVWLLGSGLAGLLGIRGRKKANLP